MKILCVQYAIEECEKLLWWQTRDRSDLGTDHLLALSRTWTNIWLHEMSFREQTGPETLMKMVSVITSSDVWHIEDWAAP